MQATETRIVSIRPTAAKESSLLSRIADSTVPAGFPSPAEGLDEQFDLEAHLIRHHESTFFLRVSGDSMTGLGIFDGDLLVVDRELEPRSGDIVIAVFNGEFTVKRFRRNGSMIELLPENPAFPKIRLAEGVELEIWGVVTGAIRKFR